MIAILVILGFAVALLAAAPHLIAWSERREIDREIDRWHREQRRGRSW